MADKKISALTAASTPLAGTEVLPIVQSGATVKVTNNDLRPKQIQSNATSGVLQVAGPGAASTRVMTTPDANFTAARTDAAQTFTGTQTVENLITGINGLVENTSAQNFYSIKIKDLTISSSSTLDLCSVTFDSIYGEVILEIDVCGTGASAAPYLISAKRRIAYDNGTPAYTTVGTDTLENLTLTFTDLGSKVIKVTINNSVAQIMRGGAVVATKGGGSHLSGAKGVTLTML
jgi:hypothetical protein